MNFDIKTQQLADDAYVIALAGEVDLYTAPEFKQQLLEVIGRGATQVIVDFTSTTFIDSTTLGVLVGGVKRLRPGGRPAVARLQRPEHRQDLRDHGSRPRLRHLRHARRRRRESPRRHSTVVVALKSALALTVVLLALLASGCGAVGRVTEGDPAHGKQLFLQSAKPSEPSCASCHTLADAKSQGTVGPNLDDAFAAVKTGTFSEEQTIRDVVRGQIAYPEEPMPANLYRGQDARDIAVYIAKCAGNRTAASPRRPRAARPPAPRRPEAAEAAPLPRTARRSSRRAGCGGCHTLKDAGSSGNVGPNLDQLKPSEPTVAAPGRSRRRRDAVVQGPALRRRDQGRREVRQLSRRQVASA